MNSSRSIKLNQIVREFSLQVLYRGSDYDEINITVDSVDRPGLPLVGYYGDFEPQRLQLIGNAEYGYLAKLSAQERAVAFDRLLSYPFPALIYCRGFQPFAECMELAEKHQRTILCTGEQTGEFMSTLTATLKNLLSPRITRHGVLMEVYGEGVLLVGESGVGKSENAIELLKRGHRLIADDAVDIVRTTAHSLTGSAPELIRYYMELRGIGVVDVRQLFGMGAVRESVNIDLIINIEQWKDDVIYDRIGLDDQYSTILDVQVPTITVPVKPGRNLAIIIEVAAMNNRQKKLGYNAAEVFTRHINEHFSTKDTKW